MKRHDAPASEEIISAGDLLNDDGSINRGMVTSRRQEGLSRADCARLRQAVHEGASLSEAWEHTTDEREALRSRSRYHVCGECYHSHDVASLTYDAEARTWRPSTEDT